MMQPTLFFGATFVFLSAGIYFYVGRVLSRRHQASSETGMAWSMFVVWWYALALATLSSGMLSLLGGFGLVGLPLFTTINIINFLTLSVALMGLMYYLVYLYTGNRNLIWPIGIFYFLYYGLLVYFIEASNPVGVTVNRWNTALQFENTIRGPLYWIALVLLVFPQIIASLAYFILFFRVNEMTQKYRILLVSWSILIWFMSSFLGSISGLSQQDWWQIVSRLIGLAASLTILFAYQPPTWIKRRFGVAAIAER
jgi:hypothetical protein